MKKLITLSFVLALAAAAQAAVYFTANNLGTGYEGYKIGVISLCAGSVQQSQDDNAKAVFPELFLSKGSTETWAEHYAAVNDIYKNQIFGTVADGTGVVTYPNMTLTQLYSVAFMLFENGIAPGSKYVVFGTAYFDDYSVTKQPSFDMTGIETLMTGTLFSDAVPEPTSGLLLLLGMAGLALKRKRT